MDQPPQRRPGDSNPAARSDAPDRAARESQMSNSHGSGDFGIARALVALVDWVRRRRASRR